MGKNSGNGNGVCRYVQAWCLWSRVDSSISKWLHFPTIWIINPSRILSNVLSGVTSWISDWFWSRLTWLMKWQRQSICKYPVIIRITELSYKTTVDTYTGNLTHFYKYTISICWKGGSKVASSILMRQKPTYNSMPVSSEWILTWTVLKKILHMKSSFI